MKTKENSTLRKSLVIDLEKIKDLYIKQNKTKKIVAAEIGCSEATLGRLLKENDIRKRALDRYQNYNDLRPIIESKVESGMSVGKICEELNITNGTFHNILGDEKIKRNSNKIDES